MSPGDGWRERSKLQARADQRGNSGGAGWAMSTWLGSLCTARALLEGQQADDGQRLLHSVEARVLRNAHARLVPLAELVVLLDLRLDFEPRWRWQQDPRLGMLWG